MGIQGTVRRMIGKHGHAVGPIGSEKEPYKFDETFDLYYLTKHIADEKSAPVYARGLTACLEHFFLRMQSDSCCLYIAVVIFKLNKSMRVVQHFSFYLFCAQNSEQIKGNLLKLATR
jgi:hypothetical protein